MSKLTKGTTTKEKVAAYETTEPLLEALYKEIQDLSKKKPDGTLNQTKVKMINRLLQDIQSFLKDEPDNKYLDLLEDESLPQYSDVTLILSQWSSSVKKFHEKYYGWDARAGESRWFVK